MNTRAALTIRQWFEAVALQVVNGGLAMRSSAFWRPLMAAGWTWSVSVH